MTTFWEAAEHWLEDLESRGFSLQSTKQYRCHLRVLARSTNDEWPTARTLTAHLGKMRKEGAAASTSHHHAVTYRSFFRWAAEQGYCESALGAMKVPKRPHKAFPVVLSDDEIKELVNWNPRSPRFRQIYRKGEKHLLERDKAIVRLITFTGLRRAEVAGLDVGDVETRRRVITVRFGKGNKSRTVRYPELLDDDMKELTRGRRGDEALFAHRRVNQRLTPNGITYIFVRLSKAFGRRIHPHLFRHAFGTYLARSGANVREIQELMGHDSLDTTMIYLQVTGRDLDKAVGLFDEGFGAGMKKAPAA